jgi:hypothetical protein
MLLSKGKGPKAIHPILPKELWIEIEKPEPFPNP